MISAITKKYTIILYDGECGFCNHWIRWILRHNPSDSMRFIALQSESGRKILDNHNLDFDLKSIIVVRKDKAYQKSQAIFLILNNLISPLRHVRLLFHIIPTFIADTVYDIIAKYRYSIIGKTDTCEIPSPEQRKYFLT